MFGWGGDFSGWWGVQSGRVGRGGNPLTTEVLPRNRWVNWHGHRWPQCPLPSLAFLSVWGLLSRCGRHSQWSNLVPGCGEEAWIVPGQLGSGPLWQGAGAGVCRGHLNPCRWSTARVTEAGWLGQPKLLGEAEGREHTRIWQVSSKGPSLGESCWSMGPGLGSGSLPMLQMMFWASPGSIGTRMSSSSHTMAWSWVQPCISCCGPSCRPTVSSGPWA